MIRDVHPASRIQESKRHRISEPQHWKERTKNFFKQGRERAFVPVKPEEHGRVPVDPEHEALRLGLREAGHLAVEAGLTPGHLLHIEHHRPAHNTTDGILE